MQMEIECPFHGAMETMEVPDKSDFVGEILCSTPVASRAGLGARLRVRIVDGKLVSVEQAVKGPGPFPTIEA